MDWAARHWGWRRRGENWLVEAAVVSALFAVVSVWAAGRQHAEPSLATRNYHRIAQQFCEGHCRSLSRRRLCIHRRRRGWPGLQSAAVPDPAERRRFCRRRFERAQGRAWLLPGEYFLDLPHGPPPRVVDAALRSRRRLRPLALTLWLLEWHAPAASSISIWSMWSRCSAERRGGAARDGASAACAGLHGDAGGDATPVSGNAPRESTRRTGALMSRLSGVAGRGRWRRASP